MIGLLYRAADALRARANPNNHGRIGEDLAHRYLRKHGCTVVARNYRPPSGHGEIDIVAWDGETLVFVEVKTRESTDFGPPDRAVDEEKRENVERAAQDYARRAGIEFAKARFDIVSVTLTAKRQIEWFRDAWSPRAKDNRQGRLPFSA